MRAYLVVSTSAIVVACGFTTAGCEEDRPELEPASGTKAPAADLETPDASAPVNPFEAAVNKVGDVKVTVEAGFWPGAADIKTEVTPLRVIVNNESQHKIRLNYEDMRIVDNDGEVYAALPPFQIDAEAEEPITVTDVDIAPDWTDENYEIVSYYRPLYNDVVIYEGETYPDIDYYTEYYTYWTERELPTSEMLNRALPEGVLKPKGKVDGWVYFEQVDEDEQLAEFTASLINAETGRRFGQVRIPFKIEETRAL